MNKYTAYSATSPAVKEVRVPPIQALQSELAKEVRVPPIQALQSELAKEVRVPPIQALQSELACVVELAESTRAAVFEKVKEILGTYPPEPTGELQTACSPGFIPRANRDLEYIGAVLTAIRSEMSRL